MDDFIASSGVLPMTRLKCAPRAPSEAVGALPYFSRHASTYIATHTFGVNASVATAIDELVITSLIHISLSDSISLFLILNYIRVESTADSTVDSGADSAAELLRRGTTFAFRARSSARRFST